MRQDRRSVIDGIGKKRKILSKEKERKEHDKKTEHLIEGKHRDRGFISGALPAVLGRKKSILLFNAFFALSYLVIIFSDNNYLLALAFFLTGMARGATSNFCNQSINELAPGKASLLNGLHAMFAIGAFVFPLLLLALTSVDASNWIYACYFMLAMGILSWILYFIVPVSSDTVKKETKTTTAGFAFF